MRLQSLRPSFADRFKTYLCTDKIIKLTELNFCFVHVKTTCNLNHSHWGGTLIFSDSVSFSATRPSSTSLGLSSPVSVPSVADDVRVSSGALPPEAVPLSDSLCRSPPPYLQWTHWGIPQRHHYYLWWFPLSRAVWAMVVFLPMSPWLRNRVQHSEKNEHIHKEFIIRPTRHSFPPPSPLTDFFRQH